MADMRVSKKRRRCQVCFKNIAMDSLSFYCDRCVVVRSRIGRKCFRHAEFLEKMPPMERAQREERINVYTLRAQAGRPLFTGRREKDRD